MQYGHSGGSSSSCLVALAFPGRFQLIASSNSNASRREGDKNKIEP